MKMGEISLVLVPFQRDETESLIVQTPPTNQQKYSLQESVLKTSNQLLHSGNSKAGDTVQ